MKRRLPAPEAIPDVRQLGRPKYAPGQMVALGAIAPRAGRILARCYEAAGPIAHGFYLPAGFIDGCRRRDARDRLFRCLCARIAAKEVARGRLALA